MIIPFLFNKIKFFVFLLNRKQCLLNKLKFLSILLNRIRLRNQIIVSIASIFKFHNFFYDIFPAETAGF